MLSLACRVVSGPYHAVVIDAHHHLWDLARREHRWLLGGQPWASDDELARLRRSFTLVELAPLAAASGVTGTVVIQTVARSEEHTSELQSRRELVCRLLLEKKKKCICYL